MAICEVCFRKCNIEEGATGFCGGRICRDGQVVAGNYGRVTSMALDPIEKKPLRMFMPGSLILSVGSYGCNLRCPFCQNSDISWSERAMETGRIVAGLKDGDGDGPVLYVSPEELAQAAEGYRGKGNIGVAFTYNEPLIGYEFVRDAARLIREAGMKNVLVTNGCASLEVLDELLPHVDAMNIDLKGFTDRFYSQTLGGDRKMVMDFIERAAAHCHVELTSLIIPGENDSEEEMREMTTWIAGLGSTGGSGTGRSIPLHISRFFPSFKMTDGEATDVDKVLRLVEVAKEDLDNVFAGNC